MDLSFLAFLTINDGDGYKPGEIYLGDRYTGKHTSLVHVYKDTSIPEGIMFLDRETGKGLYRSWHPNGKDHYIFELKNGKNDGHYYEMYDNGNVKVRGLMQDGKIHGPYFQYHSNGNIQCILNYDTGELRGVCEYFSEDGLLERRDDHLNTNTFERKLFYPNRLISARYKFLDGKPIEKHVTYYPNGAVSSLTMYSMDHEITLKRVYKGKFSKH